MNTSIQDSVPFSLMDLGLRKHGPVQLYDSASLDVDGNIIPFDTQLAVVTHYIQNYGTKHDKTYREKGNDFINIWAKDDTLKPYLADIACDMSPLQMSLFDEINNVPFPAPPQPKFTFIDLFAGIGGFRLAMQDLGGKCVYSSEWDEYAKRTYFANYGEVPFGDITKPQTKAYIPDNFDVLCAGFPCQAFSIIGKMEGFNNETCGTLFFDIEQILKAKKPKAFILENVRNLTAHDNGKTFKVIKAHLEALGYTVYAKVLNALDFGVPQKRERIIIVGFRGQLQKPVFD